ncbi:MAG: type II toxin-antitoxin system HicB family antitoxin [Nitrospirae bacterium]|nr:type II toxin-antitoxin system HicB family antitoxin [Nitrospirota bacterium]
MPFRKLAFHYDCKQSGDEPDRPFKGSFNVRIGMELHKRAALTAEKKGISLNQLVQKAIEREVAHSG